MDPKTPKKEDSSLRVAELQTTSTTYSNHTSSYSPHITDTKVDAIDPFIEKDVIHFLKVETDPMIHSLFRRDTISERDIEKEARLDTQTGSLLLAYTKLAENLNAKGLETDLYHPFCELANHILHIIMDGKPRITFCRNDRKRIKGHKDSLRVPDVVCVSSDLPAVSDGKWKTFKDNGPPDSFEWRDVLHVFEFKMGKRYPKDKETIDPPQPEPEVEAPVFVASSSLTQATSELATDQADGEEITKSKRKRKDQSRNGIDKRSKPELRKTEPRRDFVKQNCRYAVELMSMVENRTHVISALVAGCHIWLCYYDRSGIVYGRSIPLNTEKGLIQFILVLSGLNSLSNEERGFCGSMKEMPNGLDTPMHNPPSCDLSSKDASKWCFEFADRKLILSEPLFWRSNYVLLGRGTRVFRAKEVEETNDIALKLAWIVKKRMSEAEIIKLACQRLQLLVKDANFRAQHNVDNTITDRLPSVRFSKDIQELKDGVRGFLELIPSAYENRVYRVIAFEILIPIYKLTNIKDFMKAYRDIFQVLHFLWQEKIAHRDISVGNLMVRMDAHGKFKCGVLNDWDLAKVDGFSTESLFRTGTRAFLATDLLQSVSTLHIVRFDWESALYVLIWITTRYEDGEEKYTDVLNQWFNINDEIASNAKSTYIDHVEKRPGLKTFKLLHQYWIHPWAVLYRNGFQARSDNVWARRLEVTPANESFDDETLGGRVTYEKIWDILKQDLVEDNS